MPAPFPHQYEVALRSDGSQGLLEAPPRPVIVGGAPPQFDGQDGWWSPEELLLAAVGLCHMTTFQAFAKRAALPIASYVARIQGTLDKTAEGLRFTHLAVHVDLSVALADTPRAENLVRSAERHCIISNSLRAPVALSFTVNPT